MTTIQRGNGSTTVSRCRTSQTYRAVSAGDGSQMGGGWNSMPPRWQAGINQGNPMMTSITASLGGGEGIYDVVATSGELQRT